jgi:hypothetical protein
MKWKNEIFTSAEEKNLFYTYFSSTKIYDKNQNNFDDKTFEEYKKELLDKFRYYKTIYGE